MRSIKHNSLDGYNRLRAGGGDIRGGGAGRYLASQAEGLHLELVTFAGFIDPSVRQLRGPTPPPPAGASVAVHGVLYPTPSFRSYRAL